jgi:hypothetical protein
VDFPYGNKSDNKKSDWIRLIENKDIAQQFAIIFFCDKAFYCDKKSSLFFVGNRARSPGRSCYVRIDAIAVAADVSELAIPLQGM